MLSNERLRRRERTRAIFAAQGAVARMRARRFNSQRRAVEAILDAPAFDAAAVAALANRANYPNAARALLSELTHCFRDSIVPALLAPDSVKVGRVTAACCLAQRRGVPETLERLRARAAKSERARIALAALGHCNWHAASRRARAAYALGHLVDAFRERAP